MSVCVYCGLKAKWYSSVHPACEGRSQEGRANLIRLSKDTFLRAPDVDEILLRIQTEIDESKLSPTEARTYVLRGLSEGAEERSKTNPLSSEELFKLRELLQSKRFWPEGLELKTDRLFGFAFGEMAAILVIVKAGSVPIYGPGEDPADGLFFNFTRSERPIISTGRTILGEYQTAHSAGYQSISMPLGGGLRYNVGMASSQNSSPTFVQADEGRLLITTESLYFAGNNQTFRIPFNSVLRFEPFIDGFGVFPSHGSGKVFIPDYSGMDTGWFFSELVMTLAAGQNS